MGPNNDDHNVVSIDKLAQKQASDAQDQFEQAFDAYQAAFKKMTADPTLPNCRRVVETGDKFLEAAARLPRK